MSLYAVSYLLVFVGGTCAGLLLGPVWLLLTYVFVYFNIPEHQWWGSQVPQLRWSLVTAIFLILSCVLHRRKLQLPPLKNYPLRFLTLLLLLMTGISFIGFDTELSLQKSYEFFRYLVVFFLVTVILDDFKSYKHFVYVLLFGLFNLSLMARHRFSGERLDGVGLADANDANMLAALILLVLPLLVACLISGGTLERLGLLAASPFILDMFAMCRSRGAFLGVAVQMVIAFWVLRRSVGRAKLIAAGALCFAVMFSFMDSVYIDRLLGVSSQMSEGEMSEASAGRTEVWKYGLDIAGDYPLGAGSGAFMALSPSYFSYEKIGKGVRASHNTYLMVLVEQGVLGLTIYCAFIVSTFRMLSFAKDLLVADRAGCTENGKIAAHCTALLIALAGFWSAALFIDRVYFEGIYLVAALAPVMAKLAYGRVTAVKDVDSQQGERVRESLAGGV